MNIRCPSCQTVFRVDPARVPATGIRARCSRCGATFPVRRPQPEAPEAPTAAAAPAPASSASAAEPPATPAAGSSAAGTPAAQTVDAAREQTAAAGAGTPAATAPSPVTAEPTAAAAPAPPPSPARRAPHPAPSQVPSGSAVPTPEPQAAATATQEPATGQAAAATAEPQRPQTFGSRDPNVRATRIARALVSDIIAYHPKRWEASRAAGTLRAEFRDEILKSWEEYVAQVGLELAKSTPHFRAALNDILAGGEQIF